MIYLHPLRGKEPRHDGLLEPGPHDDGVVLSVGKHLAALGKPVRPGRRRLTIAASLQVNTTRHQREDWALNMKKIDIDTPTQAPNRGSIFSIQAVMIAEKYTRKISVFLKALWCPAHAVLSYIPVTPLVSPPEGGLLKSSLVFFQHYTEGRQALSLRGAKP